VNLAPPHRSSEAPALPLSGRRRHPIGGIASPYWHITRLSVILTITMKNVPQSFPRPASGRRERAAAAISEGPLPPALARWTATLLSRAAQKMRQGFESRVAHLGLRSKHYGVLALLEERPLTQIEIGRGLWVDRTTMVTLIDELESLGMVERERYPGDRRAYAVTLTEKGRKILREATEFVDANEAEFFAALSKPEREQLRALLAKLL
jgi:DNA-binding MarR family transcriptional regulator